MTDSPSEPSRDPHAGASPQHVPFASPPPRMSPDALPPVEPPSAGFIIQLFVIPAVIVGLIIVVWALFNWMAHAGTDPKAYVEALRRDRANRWQEAHNLATEMNTRGGEAIKRDPETARELCELLQAEIDGGDNSDESIKLRYFLCVALGQFEIPDVLPTLITAVNTERDESERDVRLAALQGLARLIPNLDGANLRRNDTLTDAIFTATQDSDPVVRYHGAYTFGVLGGERALARLRVLADDPHVDVQMNAATGLARHGDAACVPVLVKMLDPANLEPVQTEKQEALQEGKHLVVQVNALEACQQYRRAAPSADVEPLRQAIDGLIAANPPAAIRAKAEEAKRALAK